MRDPIAIETDFVRVMVDPKGDHNHARDFLLEHALHQLMAEYRQQFGRDAALAVLHQLYGYHGRE